MSEVKCHLHIKLTNQIQPSYNILEKAMKIQGNSVRFKYTFDL